MPMLSQFRLMMRTVNLLAPLQDDAHRLGTRVEQGAEQEKLQVSVGSLCCKSVLPVLPVLGPLEWSPYRLRASVQGFAGPYTCVAVGHLLPPVPLRSHDTLGGRCIANGECLDVRAGEEVRKRREVIETGTEGHVMIGYKLVEVVFPYLGLQQRAEALIKDSQMSMYSQPFSSPSCAPWPCAPLAAVSAQEDAGQRTRCTPPGPRQCRAIAKPGRAGSRSHPSRRPSVAPECRHM